MDRGRRTSSGGDRVDDRLRTADHIAAGEDAGSSRGQRAAIGGDPGPGAHLDPCPLRQDRGIGLFTDGHEDRLDSEISLAPLDRRVDLTPAVEPAGWCLVLDAQGLHPTFS